MKGHVEVLKRRAKNVSNKETQNNERMEQRNLQQVENWGESARV